MITEIIHKSFEDIFGDCSGQAIWYNINCTHKSLVSLNGSPKIIIGIFNCSRNKLKTLFHSPKAVEFCYYANYNQLFSADFLPTVSYDISIFENWDWNQII